MFFRSKMFLFLPQYRRVGVSQGVVIKMCCMHKLPDIFVGQNTTAYQSSNDIHKSVVQKNSPVILFQQIQSIDKVRVQGLYFREWLFHAVLQFSETLWNHLPYIVFSSIFCPTKIRNVLQENDVIQWHAFLLNLYTVSWTYCYLPVVFADNASY